MDVQPCLVCGSTRWAPTGLTNAYGTGADVVCCLDCGVRYYTRELYPVADTYDSEAHRKLAQDSLDLGAMNNNDPAQAERFRAARASLYNGLLDELAQHAKPFVSLYEVGTHVGYLLAQAAERGIQVGGCEVNVHAAVLANRAFGLGVEPICFQRSHPGVGWDAVAMLDVIEHTPTPTQDLELAGAVLRPGGILLLKTFYEEWHDGRPLDLSPGSGNLSPDENLRRRGYYGIGHRCHWTTDALLALLARTGFGDQIVVRHEPIYGQVTIIARRA